MVNPESGVGDCKFAYGRQFGIAGVRADAIDTPKLTSLFVEEPTFFFGCLDNAASEKSADVLVGSGIGTKTIEQFSTDVTLSSTQYSQHFYLQCVELDSVSWTKTASTVISSTPAGRVPGERVWHRSLTREAIALSRC
jgi:hypothetical protein